MFWMLEKIDIIWIHYLKFIWSHKTISFKEIVGTGKKEINFSEVEIDKAKDYAAEDADITFRLYKKFIKI